MNNLDTKIHPLTLSDLDEVKRIDDLVFPNDAEYRHVYEDRIVTFPEGCFKVTVNDAIAGFITAEAWDQHHTTILNRKASVFHVPQGRIIYISALGFLPEYQGKGLGGNLMRFFADSMKSGGRESLYLRAANTARRFYERLGFILVKQEDHDGELNDVMEMRL